MEDKHFRVLIIGGPPMAGKTTLGRRLAARLGWCLISGDDLSLAARGVTHPAAHPALHAMKGIDYREYYARHSIEELIQHMRKDHEALWEGMRKVIFAHSIWADPAVVEGWQFYPGQIVAMKLANVRSIWLNPDSETLQSRIRHNVDFYRGAADEETMISHYVRRNLWQNAEIARAAHELKLPIVPVTSQVSMDGIKALVLRLLA
jgi:2-phosphoglycerate kinase